MDYAIFTVPADFKIETLKKYSEGNANRKIKIAEVYGSLKHGEYGAGRRSFDLANITWDEFCKYIQTCNELGIEFNYTINASCMGNVEFDKDKRNELLDFVSSLYDIGIRSFTVAIPSVAHFIWRKFKDVKITLSIIAGIDTLDKARVYAKYGYIHNIYVHEKLNRNPRMVREIVKIAKDNNINVGMIVNSLCLNDCPFRQFHYNFTGHMTQPQNYVEQDYYAYLCLKEKILDVRNVLNASWIRPNDIKALLDAGITRFKVAGRERNSRLASYEKVVDYYNSGKYEGNIALLLTCFVENSFSKIFNIPNNVQLDSYMNKVFEEKILCNRFGCTNCGACKSVLDTIVINKDDAKKWVSQCDSRISNFLDEPKQI